jgi:putative ABC transport system permease protein
VRLTVILRSAVLSLRRTPARSAFTTLGVIVGVAAIVTTASIGQGAEVRIQDALANPRSRTIYLRANVRDVSNRGHVISLAPADGLHPQDYTALRQSIDHVAVMSPRIFLPAARLQAKGRAAEALLAGIDVGGFAIAGAQLLKGSLFSTSDVGRAALVCVVNESLSQALGRGGEPSSLITINGIAFSVLGVVADEADLGESLAGAREMRAYIPFTSLLRRLDRTAPIGIGMQSLSAEHVSAVQRSVSDLMEQRRGSRKAEFRTISAFESVKAYADGSLTIGRLLAAVGAVSLLTGGIGIMNIMLVSVRERAHEIGIRMAVGTRRRDILSQILTEAAAVSLVGGALGVVVGVIASWLVTRVNGWPTTITAGSMAAALLYSAAVGLFFGYHPARRAALLNPVEALRMD